MKFSALLLAAHLALPVDTSSFFASNSSSFFPTTPTRQEIYQLAQVIEEEAAGESFRGKLAVGNVVINRMKSGNQTLKEVIFQPGQFTCIRNGLKALPSSESLEAAVSVFNGGAFLPDHILYYYNPETADDKSFIRKVVPFIMIDSHIFGYITK